MDLTLLTRSGQAHHWLSTGPAPGDQAVWAVTGDPGRAAYVGSGQPEDEPPLPDRPDPAWVALLAGAPIEPPADPLLARLWQQYVQAARDVR